MLSTTLRALPLPVRERQRVVDMLALGIAAKLAGRVESPDPNAALKVPHGLVLDLMHELAEGSIEDRAGETWVSAHSFRVQVLDAEQIVLPRQVGRQFVQKVASLVGNLAMNASCAALRFLPPFASRLFPAKVFLSPPELPVGLASKPRSRNALAIGKNQEVFESEVDPDRIDGSGRIYIRYLELSSQRNVPVSSSVTLERGAPGLALDFAGLADANPADLGDVDLAGFYFDPLGDAESEVSGFLGAKPGKAAALFEERLESPMHVLKSLLEQLRVCFFEPRRIRLTLERREFRRSCLAEMPEPCSA